MQETNPCPGNVYSAACPSRRLLELIADKWSVLILPALSAGPLRNGELLRRIDGVSQKMLTQTLRELERNGLVTRHDYGEVPPKVAYRLTPLGQSLSSTLRNLEHWVEQHFGEVEVARTAYEQRSGDRQL